MNNKNEIFRKPFHVPESTLVVFIVDVNGKHWYRQGEHVTHYRAIQYGDKLLTTDEEINKFWEDSNNINKDFNEN